MNRLPLSLRRAILRAVYLLPAISGLTLLIWACTPHIFFLYGGKTYDTWNLFSLLGNAWSQCQALLSRTVDGSSAAFFFAYAVSALVILSWILIVAFALLAILSASLSSYAFTMPPTSGESNRAKRWLRFFCPNRFFYVLTLLFPLLPAAFPHILCHLYRTRLAADISVFYMGPDTLTVTGILVALNLIAFLATLPLQRDERMDMYRLYKLK